MKFSEAFRETMFRFDLKGKDIAEKSGLNQSQVSKFRNGENLRIDSVEKILEALEQLKPEAKEFMLHLIASGSTSGSHASNYMPFPLKTPVGNEE